MKFVILVCLLISVTTRALEIDLISKVMNLSLEQLTECMQNSNLSSEDIENMENIFNGDQASIKQYSPNFGCFVTCVYEKSNLMKDNKIQLDTLYTLAKRNKFPVTEGIKRKIVECVAQAEQEDDKCMVGLIFTSCLVRKLRQ